MALSSLNHLLSGDQKDDVVLSALKSIKTNVSYIVESILSRLDRKMYLEKCKVVLFWDNATCHPEALQASLTNIKLVFIPKNKTSRLQTLDAGIIRNFKHKYRKLFVLFVVSLINAGKTASQIIEDVHILKAINWFQTARRSVSTETIKQCFIKCGFVVGEMS